MALVEIGGAFRVAGKVAPAGIQQLHLDVSAAASLAHHHGKPAPSRFHRLKIRVMENGVHLAGQRIVDEGDELVGKNTGVRKGLMRHERAPGEERGRGGRTTPVRVQFLDGIRATMRSDVVSSSICNQGRIHATAL
ncbi:hypothetical protein D3C72_934910 [compost metagenome]